MASSSESWVDSLQYSSLFWPSPRDSQQRKAQITAYVEYFGQFTSDQFQDNIAELVKSRYPSKEERLLDDVLATFVLHHPEFCEAVIHPIISCIIDGTLVYDGNDPPFASFISLVCPSSESDYSQQWALACMEILRILTLYNRPYKIERPNCEAEESGSSSSGSASKKGSSSSASKSGSCNSASACESVGNPTAQPERKLTRPLSPWITDILLAAPLGIRSDYFRWCGGVVGKYSVGELKPPIAITSRGSGKHPQLMPSTPRWAVANGAGVILSVCDEEVARYDTVTLTAAAVPALLLPPPTIHEQVAGLPALEPYARLFHRYYAIATPSATQRLLLGLLEAPPSWAPDALDAAVQLVELLRAAEEYASGVRLPRNWMHLHFLRAIGTAMSMRAGISADAAAALLFRILSQPALLFPPLRQVEGVGIQHEPLGGYVSSYRKQIEVPSAEATIEATAQGIASMLCAHGPEVEWRICTIWEAAYGLIPLSSSAVDIPEIIVATPLQPPVLSWNLYIPLLKVLEYLPRGSPSEACLMKIFVATVEAILQRTHPLNGSSHERTVKTRYLSGMGHVSKNLSETELRTMVHSLFLESCASVELASRLLFVVLTVCISHEAQLNGTTRPTGEDNGVVEECPPEDPQSSNLENSRRRKTKSRKATKQGPVAAFNSFVLGAVCALSHELRLFTWISRGTKHSNRKNAGNSVKPTKVDGSSDGLQSSFDSAIHHSHRILTILEALFSLKPSSIGTSWGYSPNEIVAAAMVAAHVSELFRQSKACMSALSTLMQCKLDNEIKTRASSLYNLIDIHSKAVASIVNKAEPLQAQLMQAAPVCRESFLRFDQKQNCAIGGSLEVGQSSVRKESSDPMNLVECGRPLHSSEGRTSHSHDSNGNTFGKGIAGFPVDASDLANFLTMDRHLGFDFSAKVLLRSVLTEKHELCFSVVSLLWHKLITAPEILPSAESTSAQQGWRQVVDALCNVVSESPTNAATAVVLQAERELQPWIAKDDDQGQKMWRINQRIIRLIVELMRNHERPESLVILASASDLLLRATDGLLVDGEACTLPQLELLEVTARAVQLVLDWGESGLSVADGLSNLLKCRISATVRCLSHPSAHVRALSTSVLRDILNTGSINSKQKPQGAQNKNGVVHSSATTQYQLFELEEKVINWKANIEKCLTWEAHSRLSSAMSLQFLNTAAKELGCAISL